MTTIGASAFYQLKNLTSVSVGNGVQSIGKYAFEACNSLNNLQIGSVNYIDERAFGNCTSLTSIELPNNLISIGQGAFAFCKALTSVDLGNSVEDIGTQAFVLCESLSSIILPNTVKYIGVHAFSNSPKLATVSIGNSVTTIDKSAFYNCKSLKSITIPASVDSIGDQAFNKTDLLTVITKIENPFELYALKIGFRTFSEETYKNATLYVPSGTIKKYKETEGWKDFANIIEGDPSAISSTSMDDQTTETARYTLSGKKLNESQKGLNIIRYNNGSVKKKIER